MDNNFNTRVAKELEYNTSLRLFRTTKGKPQNFHNNQSAADLNILEERKIFYKENFLAKNDTINS